jgi:peptidoglycan/xylan/chitin deacetylase (PgdA/CDA1 family)
LPHSKASTLANTSINIGEIALIASIKKANTAPPRLMSVGLHCRLAGRPGRALGLTTFINYVQSKEKVWIAKRIDIARHWHKTFA